MSSAKVTVTVPENVTFVGASGHVYRTGDVFEVELADAAALIRNGNLVEVKPAKKR